MKYILLLLLLNFNFLLAQKPASFEVTRNLLEQKAHQIDTSAVACVLSKTTTSVFDYQEGKGFFQLHTTEIYFKIFKKEGLKYGNYSAKFRNKYEAQSSEKIKVLESSTYNLIANEIEKTTLLPNGIFTTSLNEYESEVKITMPNVRVGSIIKIKYRHETFNLVRLPVLVFQLPIPVDFSEYITDIPEVFIYKPVQTGFDVIVSESKLVEENKSISRCTNKLGLKLKYIQATYTVKNLNAYQEEPFVDNPEHYKPAVYYELERTRFPDEPVKDYTQTWNGVAKTIFEDSRFGAELKKNSYFDKELETIIKDKNTQIEKCNAIFDFVKTKMTWDKDYGIFTDKGVKKAFAENVGNAAEINFILIAMLSKAGLMAKPVLITTKSGGIPVYPTRTCFNYVIASCNIDNKEILLDATRKYSKPDLLSSELLNWTGRQIQKNGDSMEIDLVPKKMSNKSQTLTVKIDEKGHGIGKIRLQYSDYEAINYHENKLWSNQNQRIEYLEKIYSGIEISNYKRLDLLTETNAVIEEFDFVSNNLCDKIKGKLHVNPLLYFGLYQNPFVQPERQMPISFVFPNSSRTIVNIEFSPKSKSIVIPNPQGIKTEDAHFAYVYNNFVDKNIVQITSKFINDQAMYRKEYYDNIVEFYKKIVDINKQKIIVD